MNKEYDVVILGSGASGMMSAIVKNPYLRIFIL